MSFSRELSLALSICIGIVLSLGIGLLAYRRGSLDKSGVVGAVLTGTAIFGFGGFVPGLLLVAFFISSTVLSHYKARVKEKFSEKFQKGSRRDLGQALANGGWAAVIAVGIGMSQWNQDDMRLQLLLFAAFLGAMATVTADTWATEIGVLSARAPRMLTTWHRVPAGTSGAITLLGTLTALAGAAFIGIVAVLGVLIQSFAVGTIGWSGNWNFVSNAILAGMTLLVVLCACSGLAGSLFDSLLGATVQGIYFCEYDEMQTEKKIHGCGRATRLVRGWVWLDNDAVNFSASVVGSAIAFGLANLIL